MVTVFDPSQISSTQLNILDNAGFEIWQRGTTFNSVGNAAYTTDRWKNSFGGTPTVNMTQESTTVHDGAFSLKVVISAAPASLWGIFQSVENFAAYKGKTLTFTCWVNTNMANINLVLYDGTTLTAGNFHTGNSTWQQLSVTATMSPTASLVGVFITQETNGVTGTAYFDSATLTVGTQPAAFVPLNPQQDLARCQRYFWRCGGVNNQLIGTGYSYTSTLGAIMVKTPMPMRTTPSVTVNNQTNFLVLITQAAGGSTPVTGAISASNASPDAFYLQVTTGATQTVGQGIILSVSNTNATLDVSADL